MFWNPRAVDHRRNQLLSYGANRLQLVLIRLGGSDTIINRHPLPGESTAYACMPGNPAQRTYGVIAWLPNLDGSGHALLVEGVNMAGTQASGAFLLNQEQMQTVLERTMASSPPFEVLLETTSVAASAPLTRILSIRVLNES